MAARSPMPPFGPTQSFETLSKETAICREVMLHADTAIRANNSQTSTAITEIGRFIEQIRLFLEEGQHLVGVSAGGCIGGADQISINVSRAKPVLLRIAAAYGYDLTIELSAF